MAKYALIGHNNVSYVKINGLTRIKGCVPCSVAQISTYSGELAVHACRRASSKQCFSPSGCVPA